MRKIIDKSGHRLFPVKEPSKPKTGGKDDARYYSIAFIV